MSNEKSLMEEFNEDASQDAFSDGGVPGDISKQNEESTGGKKEVKKKASKVTAEPVQVEKPGDASAKKVSKKASHKASAAKAESIEPKPAKVKKAATKKTGTGQPSNDEKPKIKRQSLAKKQPSVEQQQDLSEKGAAIINPVGEQETISGEHSLTILPPSVFQEQDVTLPLADEQQTSDETHGIENKSSAQPEVAPDFERAIEPSGEQIQAPADAEVEEQSDPDEQQVTNNIRDLQNETFAQAQFPQSPELAIEPPHTQFEAQADAEVAEPMQIPASAEVSEQPEIAVIPPVEEKPVTEEQSIELSAEQLQAPADAEAEEQSGTDEQRVADHIRDLQSESFAPAEFAQSPELTIEPSDKQFEAPTDAEAPEPLQFPTNAEVSEQRETAAIPPVKEKSVAEEQSLLPEPEITDNTAAAVSATPGLSKITFQVKYHTKMGQSLYVTGNHPLLGDNNADNAFPLTWLNEEYWHGTLEIPAGEHLSENISYNYIFKDIDGTTTVEWGEDKVIQPAKHTTKEVLLVDSWNSSSFAEHTFYTEAFQQVLLKENFTEVESKSTQNATHIFRVKAPLLAKGQTLCITGSVAELGEWDIVSPILLSRKADEVWFTIELDLSYSTFPFTYKYGVFDINTNKFIQYEDGKNRILYDNASPDKLTVVSDGFAILPSKGFKGAGLAIPVFSLRSENSFGVGEFTDLKLLVDWAKQVGLKLIQLLPVNDTTATHTYTDSYPYAAISAFALHPLYLHLPALINQENPSLLNSLQEKQAELSSKAHVDYVGVMAAKWDIIKQIFPSQKQQTFNNPDFEAFFTENAHWLAPYAAFSYLREKYNTSDFNQWPTNQTFDAEKIKAIASSPSEDQDEVSMYYFVQYHLHLQLKDAANYAHENGIIVKGDIPIGIYRNSCDAWQEPHLYNMDMQAGAPPDDFAVKGQNWGFPTYNWQQMREDGFTWWKKRFKQMSYYFDAFRIDHILGFFRIWSIPMDAVEGIMGHFVPAVPVYINEFIERGIPFDAERFTRPYINGKILSEIFGDGKEDIISHFLDASTKTNFTLKPEFDNQKKVEAYFSSLEDTEQNKKIKSGLFGLVSNVILFEAEGSEGKEFHFRIAMETTESFKHFGGHVQYQLKELYLNYFYRRQDSFWMKEAMLKLPELKRSTNMLICGEDLGMVPASVPGVMKELAILSLEIQRMPKDPAREFFHPDDAPYLSVVTPSTHDMSTVRGWWEEDRAATQRFFNNELGQWGTAPYFCEPWINKIILMQHLYSPSMWSIFQLQDLLGVSGSLRRENPHEERINIPADPKHYWRYRMHITLEQLINEGEFTSELNSYIVQSGR